MTLTEQDKQKFIDWLFTKNVDYNDCIICGSDSLAILDEIVFLRTQGITTHPNVGVICNNCKYTVLFNATDSGVMDVEQQEKLIVRY